jgi:DNA-binding MarR family transcriptional regulator
LGDEVMLDFNDISELLFDNIKKIFFPNEWLKLDLKFSKSEIFAMFLIDKRYEITMTELAEYIDSPMSTATGIVDRLVKSGYIIRERSEEDRRIVVLQLTQEGSQLISRIKELISGYLNVIVEDLTEEEKQFLTGIVFKIIHSLETGFNKELPDEQNKDDIKKIDIE